jgi:hypothetical protein
MTLFRRLSRFVDLLLCVGYIASSVGIMLWIILCIQDGYAGAGLISTSSASYWQQSSTGSSLGLYPFDISMTAGKAVWLLVFGAGSAVSLVGLVLKDRPNTRYKSSVQRP